MAISTIEDPKNGIVDNFDNAQNNNNNVDDSSNNADSSSNNNDSSSNNGSTMVNLDLLWIELFKIVQRSTAKIAARQ